ncbi:MAG: hypothetical protein IJT05_02615 [Lachnospiraceae bacterium]|nr:hypothetical protein [Lachnospiraceae bacterium]
MKVFTENELTTIALDAAAVLILFGVIYYTSHYRRRGRTDDKLYFGTLIVTILCAFLNGGAYAVDAISASGFPVLNILLNDLFFITLDISFCLMTVYFDYRARRENVLSRKRVCLIALPAVLTAIALVINHITPFIFRVDGTTGAFEEFPFFYLVYAAPAIYTVIVIIVSRLNRGALFVLLMLIAARIGLVFVNHSISSTVLFLAVVLVFIHINEMRYAFYDEEQNSTEKKEGV